MKVFSFFTLLFSVGIFTSSFGQSKVFNDFDLERKWFVGADVGVQMSGIKSADFISSNYSPLIRISGGKWFNSKVAVQIGYQGTYFNTIADNDKHYYDFYFVEGVLNAKNIISKPRNSKVYDLLLHAGFGYFSNHYYGNGTIHGILGTSNIFIISNQVTLKFDVSAIMGWDIYQGDYDILPSLSFGLGYKF